MADAEATIVQEAVPDDTPMTSDVTQTDDVDQMEDDNNKEKVATAEEELTNAKSGDESGVLTSRKRKHRRGKPKKRKWKPYNKLTWDEKRELDDRESKRATRVRAERFAHGQAGAPYNTTQFLMEQHNEDPSAGRRDAGEGHNSDLDCGGSPANVEFLQREFCEVYDSIHEERLSSMTKHELIQEYLQLEDRVEKLENKLNTTVRHPQHQLEPEPAAAQSEGDKSDIWDAESREKVRIFQQEIRKLVAENGKLRRDNEAMRTLRLNQMSPDSQVGEQLCDSSFGD